MAKPNISQAIDDFGAICAEIADLERKKAALRAILVAGVDGAAEGDLFRVTVSIAQRETLDMAAVREHLSRQFIAAHTNITEVTVVKATARNAQKLAA
jgi:hypothetical protein